MPTKIESLDDLKSRCEDEPFEAFIRLNGGFRSYKTFHYWPGGWAVEEDDYDGHGAGGVIYWDVLNHIDGSEEGFESDESLLTLTNIGEALEKEAPFIPMAEVEKSAINYAIVTTPGLAVRFLAPLLTLQPRLPVFGVRGCRI